VPVLTFSAQLDTNIPLVEPDAADSTLKATAYFEDFLFKLFQDIENINVVAGLAYGVINGDVGQANAAIATDVINILGGTSISTLAADGAPDSLVITNDDPFPEAPIDGQPYGRRDAGWIDLDTLFIGDAPIDGTYYGRFNGTWANVTEEAPNDANTYGRSGLAWVDLNSGVIDHGSLAGLADDDHLQYLLLAGRAGGQTANGGTLATEVLGLRGSANADLGFIDLQSPMTVAFDFTLTSVVDILVYNPTIPASGAAVTSFILVNPDITITSGVFIASTVRDIGTYNQAVAPGFAVQTVFLGQPTMETTTALVQPNQSFMYAAQALYENVGAGAIATHVANILGVTMLPRVGARVLGDTLNVTNITGMTVSAAFATVAGTTINFGTIRGVQVNNPAVGLFQPGAGVEGMDALIGFDMSAIAFGGNVTKRALRSALTLATNTLMIENTGGADSDFGSGDIHFNDNAGVFFGNTVAAPDVLLFWASLSATLTFSTFFGTGGNPLQLRGTAADEWLFQQDAGGTLDIGIGFNVNAITFGTTLPTPNSNNWFVQFAGPNLRQVQIGGEYSDVLWTAGGSIDVNGQAVSDLQAFKINSVATILSGGTVQDSSTLFVSAMASANATRVQSLRVLGRSRHDGHMNNGSLVAAQITANQNDYQLGANNNQRTMNLLDSDAAYNITGIDSAFGRAQTGDRICLYNTGAFNLTLTHQDVLSLAANRIITSTGVGYVIGPNEMVWLWYDDTGTARWRMLEGTGA